MEVGEPGVSPAGFVAAFPPVSGAEVPSVPGVEEPPGFVTVAQNAWTDSPFACASALNREKAVDESARPRVVVLEAFESGARYAVHNPNSFAVVVGSALPVVFPCAAFEPALSCPCAVDAGFGTLMPR
ncbi:MAG TPA: hypothetical protein VG244_08190 [Acidimicrobiales bacterium]|nr:hypothetical protein [Acidimicrobiales bacterium]